MFLPEELDNKTFRLFVQRTWFLGQNGLPLSRSEQELMELISNQQLTAHFPDKMIDVTATYGADEQNPFLQLAALWEIYKQIDADKPKGVRSIFVNGFPESMTQRERRHRLARAFIRLCRGEVKTLSDLKYVRDLEKTVHTDFAADEPEEQSPGERDSYNMYVDHLIKDSFSSVALSFQKEAENKSISVTMKLSVALNKLPTEWIEGMTAGWQRLEKPFRKERISDLCEFLLSQEGFLQISACLNDPERAAIKMVLEHGGHVPYGKLQKVFGAETDDGYYWSERPPKSVIGRLRYKGLLFVGKVLLSDRQYKMAVIPRDLVSVLKNL